MTRREKLIFATHYPRVRKAIQRRGIEKFLLAVVSIGVYLWLREFVPLAERLLEFTILLFLFQTLKTFVNIVKMDRVYKRTKIELKELFEEEDLDEDWDLRG